MMPLYNAQSSPSTPTTTVAASTSRATTTNVTSIQNSNVTSTTQTPRSTAATSVTSSSFPSNVCQNNSSTAASTSAASTSDASITQFELAAPETNRPSSTYTPHIQGFPITTFTNWLVNSRQTIANASATQQSGASTSYSGASTSSGHFSGASMNVAGPSGIQQTSSGVSANIAVAGPSSASALIAALPAPGRHAIRLARLLKRQKVDVPNIRTLHIPLPAINSVSAMPPQPPNWNENFAHAFQSLASYKLFQVSSLSAEYRRLSELLNPLVVYEMEQIVNPVVWTRFVNTRKEMLSAKCSDRTLLKELGASDRDIARRQQSMNFTRHSAIDAAPYNENFMLLLHCTKDPANVEKILRDGFDERMGQGGNLGRGIYFTDKPLRSIAYDGCDGVIFICGVLLGDCLTYCRFNETMQSSSIYNTIVSVKEPEKLPEEKRFVDDNYFDSVCSSMNFNQYAVYNRYQCCPLYKVKYSNPNQVDVSKYSTPRFGWLPQLETVFNQLAVASTLPLHAETIFSDIERMQGLGPIDIHSTTPSQELIDGNLKILNSLGYTDDELNLKALQENDYDASRCVRVLLKQNDALQATLGSPFKLTGDTTEDKADPVSDGSSYHSSTDEDAPNERRPRQKKLTKKPTPAEPLEEDCSICCETYAKTSDDWRMLQCQHKLCVNCFKKIEVTRTTMAGLSSTFIKCPFCLVTAGIQIGICPDGEMNERVIASHCDGYEGANTILIEYKVRNGMHLVRRVAFLPDNGDGRNILRLLRIAWDRRMTFTIGTSHTTGVENAVVWNIHHKTSQRGGVSRYGFPDPTYFDRVTAELKGFGI